MNLILHTYFNTVALNGTQLLVFAYQEKGYFKLIPDHFFVVAAGIQGPTIRAEVNDRVVVHFKNFASFPLSISPIGIPYWKQSEGEFPAWIIMSLVHSHIH